MKKITLILTLIFSVNLFSQEITQEKIEGKWKVLKIVKAPESPHFMPLLEGFKEATFLFNKDGNFKIETKKESPLFSMITKETNQSKWILGKPNQIKIGSESDKFTIMWIEVKETKEEIFFDLGEEAQLPLILKVKKE